MARFSVLPSKYYSGDKFKKKDLVGRGMQHVRGRERRVGIRGLMGRPEGKIPSEDLGVTGWMILKRI